MPRGAITNHAEITDRECEAALKWLSLLIDGLRNSNAAAEAVAVSAFRDFGPRDRQVNAR